MSVDITFSKAIKLADVKKNKNLKVGRKQHLYGTIEQPSFKIYHRDYPKEYIEVIFERWTNANGETTQDIPNYTAKTKDLMNLNFNYADTYGGYYHILYELNREFGLEFAYNLDPRDENPKFEKPMSLEEYEKWEKEKPIMGKFLFPLIGNFNSIDEKYTKND